MADKQTPLNTKAFQYHVLYHNLHGLDIYIFCHAGYKVVMVRSHKVIYLHLVLVPMLMSLQKRVKRK